MAQNTICLNNIQRSLEKDCILLVSGGVVHPFDITIDCGSQVKYPY